MQAKYGMCGLKNVLVILKKNVSQMIQFYHGSIGELNLCTEDVLGVDFALALYWEISQVLDYLSCLKKNPMVSKAGWDI